MLSSCILLFSPAIMLFSLSEFSSRLLLVKSTPKLKLPLRNGCDAYNSVAINLACPTSFIPKSWLMPVCSITFWFSRVFFHIKSKVISKFHFPQTPWQYPSNKCSKSLNLISLYAEVSLSITSSEYNDDIMLELVFVGA